MCGFVTVLGRKNKDELGRMVHAVEKREPDDSGRFELGHAGTVVQDMDG